MLLRGLRAVMRTAAPLHVVGDAPPGPEAAASRLDAVFFALSDPVRRRILERLDGRSLLVSELAAPFDISLQAVSRHIQALVRAGLIQQERSGRISRCSLDAGPLLDAAIWMNRYSKYLQQQFDVLDATLAEIDARAPQPPASGSARKRTRKRAPRGK